ncbi:MAG TPA: xanthine dehydrogenase family protein molybdopterin-binding subunit [Spirochaetia bacterium]|nr:xanthine dehydrogenase family protein molybdopterin-binding subunit [Spirochaetia bacterium]
MKERTGTSVKNIATPVKRIDSAEKTGGFAEYIADKRWEGMLFAQTLRSIRSRARILSIELPEIPDGYTIVDRRDVPGKNRVKMIADDFPFFAEDVVNYIGEPILLIVGPHRETIQRIHDSIRVEYRDLEPILTLEEAERGDRPPILRENNRFAEFRITRGDPERILEEASVTSGGSTGGRGAGGSEASGSEAGGDSNWRVVRDTYRTGLQEHIYLEPQGVAALYDGKRVTVHGSMQCPYYIKNALIQGFQWDESRIRVVQTTTGGAFGGKEEYPSLIAGHVAFAAVKTGRPVQMIFDRTEDILVTTKRHPSIIRYRTVLDRKEQIAAMEVEIVLDGGAYAGLTSVVLQRAMFAAIGVYRIPNVLVRGLAYATNNVPTGAFRGFGAPQAFFAIEMHMHHLALLLGKDPLDFKMGHMAATGDQTVTGGPLREEVKLGEMIDAAVRMSGYRKKYLDFPRNKSPNLRGVGLSLCFHGCGFTGSGERDLIKARVKLKHRADGTVEILAANVEMGQGPQTTLRKIVAESLGISMDRVIYANPDTDRVPDSGPTVASRTVMIVGGLLAEASKELAKELGEKMKTRPGSDCECEVVREYRHPDHLRWDQGTFEGDAYPTYSWAVTVVEVEIDPLTCEIEVKGVWAVYDIGRAIDEKIIRGQIEGGILQGLGYATLEVMNQKDGKLLQGSITDYIIPTSVDSPKIESLLIDNPYTTGPFGAKCAGELPLVGTAPALAAAVQHALRAPIRRIPVTPEYLWEIQHNG